MGQLGATTPARRVDLRKEEFEIDARTNRHRSIKNAIEDIVVWIVLSGIV
jgi:hypothetical protein